MLTMVSTGQLVPATVSPKSLSALTGPNSSPLNGFAKARGLTAYQWASP